MRNPSPALLAAALVLLAAASASAAEPVAGKFDEYALALSWEPTFCATNPSRPECESERSDRFDASNLALHGLWPNVNGDARHDYGYCGVSPDDLARDRAGTWCPLPEPELLPATRSALAAAMPGAASCLDHHEWTRHGTCSGMTADRYFALAAALVTQVSRTHFGRFLHDHAGHSVDLDDALAAFEEDFGAGSRAKLALYCTNVGGKPALSEAHLHLANPPAAPDELGSMLLATGERGKCPSSFLLAAAPAVSVGRP